MRRVPATVITGFLGAGKTSLVRHLLSSANGRRLAVVVNEFGELGIDHLAAEESMGKVSVVGAGMRSHPGVAATVFTVLGEAGINIEMISTSPIKISCVIARKYAELAVRTLHDGFGLSLPPSERAGL